MASPHSEKVDSGTKDADAAPVKIDDKPETNGHTSPPPVTNGKDAPAPDATEDSFAEKDAPTTQKSDVSASSEAPAAGNPDGPDTAPTTQEEDKSSPKESTQPNEPKDIEMGEAGAGKDEAPKPTTDEPEKKDSGGDVTESTDAPTATETEKDVEMEHPNEQPSEQPSDQPSGKPSKAEKPAELPSEQPSTEKTSPKPNGAEAEKPASPTSPSQDDLKEASLSQLKIDGKDEPSGDVDMADAPSAPADSTPPVPSASSKVAREREDDTVEGPAPKRARTEPSESEPPSAKADVPAPAPAPAAEPATSDLLAKADVASETFKNLPSWNDPEVNARPITPYRVREYRRVLAGLKKTKAGHQFRDSVIKLWPSLADNYTALVDKPMDIGLMERNLRGGSTYSTLGHLKKHLVRVYSNSIIFNGAENTMTGLAKAFIEQAWAKFLEVPAEEPPKTKAPPKHNPTRHTEPRRATQPTVPPPRKESHPAPASPMNKVEADAYAVPPGGVPQVRRASTQNESDRPKRTIHPPKNRDIDYTAMQNFNKKKLPLDLQFGYEVVNELMDSKHLPINAAFLAPVDPVALQIPNYWSIIKKPMDLGTVKSKFVSGEYQNLQQVQQDVKLIIGNSIKFNGPDHEVTQLANKLGDLAKSHWSKKDQWMAKNAPARPAEAADVSEESDEESDEEEEAPQSASAAKAASNTAVLQLEQRLADETANLSQMLINIDNSDETMIDVQRTVVNAIRKRLIEEKDKASAQKPEKPAKSKPVKAGGKPRAGGAGGGRKSGAASAPRKSGGGGGGGSKKASKRVMTQAEKDHIANGINDLDENNITKAIDIIKKDTGQTENASGELELEIDQLTNEALHKLWELLKKVLPTFGSTGPSAPPPPAPPSAQASESPANNKGSSKSSKPKKNKPMNAREQEARIAELERLKQSYRGGQEPGGEKEPEEPLHPFHEESSDSEEE